MKAKRIIKQTLLLCVAIMGCVWPVELKATHKFVKIRKEMYSYEVFTPFDLVHLVDSFPDSLSTVNSVELTFKYCKDRIHGFGRNLTLMKSYKERSIEIIKALPNLKHVALYKDSKLFDLSQSGRQVIIVSIHEDVKNVPELIKSCSDSLYLFIWPGIKVGFKQDVSFDNVHYLYAEHMVFSDRVFPNVKEIAVDIRYMDSHSYKVLSRYDSLEVVHFKVFDGLVQSEFYTLSHIKRVCFHNADSISILDFVDHAGKIKNLSKVDWYTYDSPSEDQIERITKKLGSNSIEFKWVRLYRARGQ